MEQQPSPIRPAITILVVVGITLVLLTLAMVWLGPAVPTSTKVTIFVIGMVASLILGGILSLRAAAQVERRRVLPPTREGVVPTVRRPESRPAQGGTAGQIKIEDVGFSKNFGTIAARVEASRVWRFVCEACGEVFSAERRETYVFSASGTGDSSRDSAEQKATERVRLLLERPPIVPCPKCKHLQAIMVRERYTRFSKNLAIASLGMLVFGTLFPVLFALKMRESMIHLMLAAFPPCALIAALLYAAARWFAKKANG